MVNRDLILCSVWSNCWFWDKEAINANILDRFIIRSSSFENLASVSISLLFKQKLCWIDNGLTIVLETFSACSSVVMLFELESVQKIRV